MVTDSSTQLAQTDVLSKERIQALYRTIQRMNSVYELSDLLAFLLDQVLEDTHGQRGYLLLAQETAADDREPHLKVKAVRPAGIGVSEGETNIYDLVSRTVVSDVLKTGEPRVVDDIGQDVRYSEHLGPRTAQYKWPAIVAIPLKVADRLIGLIYIEHPKPGAFLRPDLEFVSAFAAQAAVAVDRAQQSQRRVEELERLNKVSRSVVRVTDLDQVLVRILREASQMLDVETGSVLLVDEGTGELAFRLSVQRGRTVHISQRLEVGQGVAGWVAKHGQPLLVPDVHRDPRWYGEVKSGFATRSILCVPLKIDDHVVGVLQALNKKGPEGFTERDLALLSAFATSATVAIENARLFAEARQARELRALNQTATALGGTLELETVLEIGLSQVLDVMGVEAGAVGLVDDESGELAVAATQGWRGEGVPAGTRLPAGEGILSQVVRGGEILIVDGTTCDLPISEDPLYYDEGVCAIALAPMRAGGRVVGVLSAMSYTPHTFTAEEKDVLSAIGGMFGVAVENARLYDEVRSHVMKLAYFNEVGGALTARLDLEQVLPIIMGGVISLIGVERASIFLIHEATNRLVLEYSVGGHTPIELEAPWPGIVGWIASQNAPTIANDVRRDPRFLPNLDTDTQFDTRSILGAPLKLYDRVIGVIEVLNKLEGPFTEKDQHLLVDYSKWAAIALHNARLYRELDEAYQELRDAQERMARAEAVAEMTEMVLNLTHRLNNRIGIVPPTVNRIQAKCEEELRNPYLKEKLDGIQRAADESLAFIRSIRGPLEVADEEPLDVSACLAEALRGFRRKPGIVIIEEYHPSLPPVRGTREKLVQCFCHVISNALDAMGDKGQLGLRTRHRVDGLVEAVIADDGPGISPQVLERLFELFFTTKADRGGLGLGLWWTRVYVSRLGGQVKVRSALGQGTTISIRLPEAREQTS